MLYMGIGIGVPFNRSHAGIAIPSSILDILQTYGANAHLWIPGIGNINGVTTQNWQDSAGTIQAVQDSPVGKAEDLSAGTVDLIQNTEVIRPILQEDESGKYVWEFNGTNMYLPFEAPLFQMSDDFCVIMGMSMKSSGTTRTVFSQSNNSNHSLPSLLLNNSGQLGLYALGGGATLSSFGGPTNSNTGPFMASMISKSGVISAKRNGTEVTSITLSGTYATATKASLAVYYTLGIVEHFQGSIYPVIIIKGTVADADILALEAWVGDCTGI